MCIKSSAVISSVPSTSENTDLSSFLTILPILLWTGNKDSLALWLLYASVSDCQCLLWQKRSICLVLFRPVSVVQEKKESERLTGRLVAGTTHTFTFCYWMHTLQAHGSSRHPDDQGATQQDEGLLKHHLNKVHLLWLTCGFCTASIWENAVIFKAISVLHNVLCVSFILLKMLKDVVWVC